MHKVALVYVTTLRLAHLPAIATAGDCSFQ
jgi:hypothetical protein